MIDYLTHPKYLAYEPSILPSQQSCRGGGMHVKTWCVLDALKDIYPRTRGISDSSEIEAETVLIEPLRFALPIMDTDDHNRDYETNEMLLEGLKAHNGRKVLFCTEFSMMRIDPALRAKILKVCDVVTASCNFQRNLFKYININANHILRDPIPPICFGTTDHKTRRPDLIATGNISWQKNSQQIIEVFKALKNIVHRVYIGSASLWYDTTDDPVQQRLEDEIQKHSDLVIKECNLQQIATRFQESRFGLWVAWHDTTAVAVHQMLASGMLITAANHGLASEIPVWTASGVKKQVQAVTQLVATSDETLELQSERVSTWAKQNVSYTAFYDQIQQVLKAIW